MLLSSHRLPCKRAGLAAAVVVLLLVPLAECNNSGPTTPPSTGIIGPAGGALASSDYVFEILVPPGALSSDVTFTINPVNAPGSGTLAPAYSLTPTGQTFSAPVVLSFTENVINFTATNDLSDYRVSAFTSNAWAPLANASVDPLAFTIEATATAISGSAYSVIVPSGGTCVNTKVSCAAGEDAGGCSSSCDVPLPPYGPGKCAAYAGAVSGTCASDGGPELTVQCCYPTGAPTCFTQLEPNGCGSPCSQLPGSTAVSCIPDVAPPFDTTTSAPQSTCCFPSGAPVCMASHVTGRPAPTCATSSPCAAIGGTVASCTDTGEGTDAVCCLPVGALPGTLPSPVAANPDAGAPASVDAGDEGGSDAAGGSDANGSDANDGDANGSDANGGDASGADGGQDGSTDSGDDGG